MTEPEPGPRVRTSLPKFLGQKNNRIRVVRIGSKTLKATEKPPQSQATRQDVSRAVLEFNDMFMKCKGVNAYYGSSVRYINGHSFMENCVMVVVSYKGWLLQGCEPIPETLILKDGTIVGVDVVEGRFFLF
jgi:hypothetical protein